jgi:hypothetical protein
MELNLKLFLFFFIFLFIGIVPAEAGIGVGVKWSELPIPVPYGQDVTVEINVWNWAPGAENVLVTVQFVKVAKEDGTLAPSGWFENIRIIPPLENIPVPSFLSRDFEALADSCVSEETPDASYGDNAYAAVGGTSGRRKILLLKFDVSDLPAGSKIENAWLRLWNDSGDFSGKVVKIAAVVNDAWSEETVTWRNKPATGDVLAEIVMSSPENWVEANITSHVAAEFAGDRVVSVAILTDEPGETVFGMKESAYPPVLTVSYSAMLGNRAEANFYLPNLHNYVEISRSQPRRIPKEIENYVNGYSLAYYYDNGDALWIPCRRVFIKLRISEEALGGVYTIYVDVSARSIRGSGGGLGAVYQVEAKPKIRVISPGPAIPVPVLITILAIIVILIVLFIIWWLIRKKKIELKRV